MTLIQRAIYSRQMAIQSLRSREINVFADDFAQTRRPRPVRSA